MCVIEVDQEVFYIHNEYWKTGDSLPEIKIGVVVPMPQGMRSGYRGYSVRPKEHKHVGISTKYFTKESVFVSKKAAYVKLNQVIDEKIKRQEEGIAELRKCRQAAEEQMVEELGREEDNSPQLSKP